MISPDDISEVIEKAMEGGGVKEAINKTIEATSDMGTKAGKAMFAIELSSYINAEIRRLEIIILATAPGGYEPKWDDQIEVLKKVLVKIEEVKSE